MFFFDRFSKMIIRFLMQTNRIRDFEIINTMLEKFRCLKKNVCNKSKFKLILNRAKS